MEESRGIDLIAMGRPDGPGCYCSVNALLRDYLENLSGNYKWTVVDNEAGMEHLSRRTTNNVDILCIVTEPTSPGADTADRIFKLAKKLPISIKEIGVIWNKVEDISACEERLDEIETFGYVPADRAVFDASMQGKTVFDIDENSLSLLAVSKIFEEKLNLKCAKGDGTE